MPERERQPLVDLEATHDERRSFHMGGYIKQIERGKRGELTVKQIKYALKEAHRRVKEKKKYGAKR